MDVGREGMGVVGSGETKDHEGSGGKQRNWSRVVPSVAIEPDQEGSLSTDGRSERRKEKVSDATGDARRHGAQIQALQGRTS
jgi:hypothetical protein